MIWNWESRGESIISVNCHDQSIYGREGWMNVSYRNEMQQSFVDMNDVGNILDKNKKNCMDDDSASLNRNPQELAVLGSTLLVGN